MSSLGVDAGSRSFMLDGEVNDEMLRNAWQALVSLGHSKPITCFLNSSGGDLDTGFAIYDLFRNFEQTLNIVVLGTAASSASIILLSGDNRLISESSSIMIHKGTIAVGAEDSEENLKRWIRHYEKYTDKMISLYAETMKLTPSQVKKLISLDKLYVGEEAVTAGLVHGIWNKKRQ
jgi:ATP-dependent protease ClpP protease subunit